ncbi:peptidoglycan-binding domain-containing protein [Bacillus haynesii]|nr:peptidoglycan-binding domain-containing protein [Bacillus haynesii]MEC0700151.1 peptidoglycan-binding domain-containing protein [Bacillus haynesii]MEC1532262.1 peptidoglycan-binding domain-containing protein [Bacillus haynesii]
MKFEDETVQAVKALQKRAGIVVEGIYGPKTKAKLESLLN